MMLNGKHKFKTQKIKRKKYVTFLIIPDPTKTARTIKVPKFILGFGALIVFVFVSGIIGHISRLEYRMTQNDLQYNKMLAENEYFKIENARLENINMENNEKLQVIVKETDRLSEELKQLAEQKMEIGVKLNSVEKTTDEQVGEPIELSSVRMNSSMLTNALQPQILANNDTFNTQFSAVEQDLLNLSLQLSSEKVVYERIDDKLEEMIPYWEAYPSILPVDSYVTSPFGWRRNPFGGRSSEFHRGVDLAASTGTPVKATGKGKVISATYDTTYGRIIVIDHGYGFVTRYAHNSQLLVKAGDEVERGDIIAKSGSTGRSTGPHVHYEVLVDGEPQNPLDYVYKGEE
jgi:murein DD-endopeptidase MepM/ murein hydrolase activator NlpD